MSRKLSLVAMVGCLVLVAACESAPRQRPVRMGDVDTGADSMESVRRRLKGTWNLVSLQVFSDAGQPTTASASGRLNYDEYGNMSIQATVNGAPAGFEPTAVNISGRVAIDPVAHVLTFMDVSARSPDELRVDPKMDASRRRHYEFEGELLKTTVKSASGSPVSIATWKKSE